MLRRVPPKNAYRRQRTGLRILCRSVAPRSAVTSTRKRAQRRSRAQFQAVSCPHRTPSAVRTMSRDIFLSSGTGIEVLGEKLISPPLFSIQVNLAPPDISRQSQWPERSGSPPIVSTQVPHLFAYLPCATTDPSKFRKSRLSRRADAITGKGKTPWPARMNRAARSGHRHKKQH